MASVSLAAFDLGPVSAAERAEIIAGLEPAVEVLQPGPVTQVQHAALPPELGLWDGYCEILRNSPGTGLGIYRLPDHFSCLCLRVDGVDGDGAVTRGTLLTFGNRDGLSHVPICGSVAAVSILFPLAIFPYLFGLPARELTNQTTPVSGIWGAEGLRLEERLCSCADDIERLAIFYRVLRQRLAGSGEGEAFRLIRASRAIERLAGSQPMAEVAESLGMSQRSLERLFAQSFGVSPKRYARAVRFQHALQRLIHTPPERVDWTDIALSVGMYDHSHLIHEFRDFTGMTPSEFLAIPGVGFTLDYGAVVQPVPSHVAS